MANYTTSADLLDDILFRAGEPTDTSSDYYAAAIRYLNRAYQGIWRGGGELLPDVYEHWWWMQQYENGVLTLLPVFDDGTVIVTNGNATITFSSAPQRNSANISVEGWHFKADTHADVFIITTHTSGATSATLDSIYTGSTNTTAAFKAFRIDYQLASNVLELKSPMRAYQGSVSGNQIEMVPDDILRSKWPLEQIGSGVPVNYARIARAAAPLTSTPLLHTVRFSHYGGTADTELMRIDYDFIASQTDLADDTAEPSVPREYRKILADWALFFLLQDKEDTKAPQAFQLAAAGLRQMALENRCAQVKQGTRGRIYPRQSDRNRSKGPLRTETGLLITG